MVTRVGVVVEAIEGVVVDTEDLKVFRHQEVMEETITVIIIPESAQLIFQPNTKTETNPSKKDGEPATTQHFIAY